MSGADKWVEWSEVKAQRPDDYPAVLREIIATSLEVARTRGLLRAAEQARDDAVRAALAEHTGAAIAAATEGTGAPISYARVSQIRQRKR